MIKPPSLVREYTWIWSGDEALDTPPATAPKKAKAEWQRRLDEARDTGRYDALLKPGGKPTLFSLCLIPADTWAALTGLVRSGAIADTEFPIWAGRLALRDITDTGLEDVDMTRRTDPHFPRLGQMAPAEAVNQFASLAGPVFNEMAITIAERQVAPSPK